MQFLGLFLRECVCSIENFCEIVCAFFRFFVSV